MAFPARAPLGFMLDWSGARLTDAQLVQAVGLGARAASRYIAPPNQASDWKRITPGERDAILKRMDLYLNWEWYAGRCLEGAAAGDEDAQWANQALFAIGYPAARVVPFSHDTGTVNDPQVVAYFNAVRKRLDTRWGLTDYGSLHTVQLLDPLPGVLPVAWQTKAWSGTNVAPSTMIANYQNTNQWFGGSVDENVIKAWPFGAWRSPYPEGTDDMQMVLLPMWAGPATATVPDPGVGVPVGKTWPGVFLWNGTTLTHVTDNATRNNAKAAGVSEFVLQRWTQWVEICASDPAQRYQP